LSLLTAGIVVAAAGIAVDDSGRIRRWLHLLQLEHYENERLIGLWPRRLDLQHTNAFGLSATAFVAAAVCDAAGADDATGALLLAVGGISAATGIAEWRRTEKKPFVFTGRAKRLYAVALAPGLVVLGLAVALADATHAGAFTALAVGLVLVAAAPLVLAGANCALAPVERRVNRRFVDAALAKLAAIAPLTVGITGSYGKTTTKFCVGAVLSRTKRTLVTRASFNTYLGVTRTINEDLTPEDEAFVVEMGAYRRGDVAELCELTKPTIGIVTAIGPMHLERFGSIEEIEAAKGELAEALPAAGRLITNADDPACRRIAGRSQAPVTLFGIDATDADVRATDLRITSGRAAFTLHLLDRAHPVESKLLGRHNVRNLLAAAACGLVIGVRDNEIVAALGSVEPPPHRLAPIVNRATGVVVIDDAYNSNPEGAAGALEVLAEHEASRRLLVTPGMVELGDRQDDANQEFGRQAGRVCDLVVLVGPEQTEPIRLGLLEAGLDGDRIVVASDIEHATSELARLVRAGDVVLFENDLPDTYTNGRARS
jgi:UDP-N-acetylmuramoyl-tripeptide--D-alanyl-D-alanine ligase